MKILKKWLYKIALPTAATPMIAPVVVSCSVEKPKVETPEQKADRLEHQKAMELAPNLTKFLNKHKFRYYDNSIKHYVYNKDYIYIKDIKHLKELTSNINHLNDFEKSYLGLYEDIQNFFDNSIHKYTKDNISFDYIERVYTEPGIKHTYIYTPSLKLEEDTLKPEQMFYYKIQQVIQHYKDNDDFYFEYDPKTGESGYTKQKETRETSEGIRYLEDNLLPIINEKVAEFGKKHQNFQFKNPKLTFRKENDRIVIQVALEVEYQNQKLPKELIIPLTFSLKPIKSTYLKTEKELVEIFNKEKKEISNNSTLERKNVKTLTEMENILKSEDKENLEWRLEQSERIKRQYDDTIKEMEF